MDKKGGGGDSENDEEGKVRGENEKKSLKMWTRRGGVQGER